MGYGLTAPQVRLLSFLKQESALGHPCPSYEEIRAHMGFTLRSDVFRVVKQLEQRGYVRKLKYLRRSIEVVDDHAALASSIRNVLSSCDLSQDSRDELSAHLRLMGVAQ